MRILLLDSYNLLYRSFTSLPLAITGRGGLPINAVYGMLAAVQRLSRDLDATHAVAAFDTPDIPTFRHRLYPGYQGHRGPLGGEQAEEFARQVEIARSLLPQINVPAIGHPGYEADDVMGTLARRFAAAGHESIIVSTDRDLLQLVSPGIACATPANPPVVAPDAEAVRARLGVRPEGVTTWKALAGDASDNIPGVAGVGAKGAARLVEEHGTLEEIYEALDSLPARTARALEAGREDAFLFRTVVTVVTDLDLNVDPATLAPIAITPEDRPRTILNRFGYGEEEIGTPGGIRTPGL